MICGYKCSCRTLENCTGGTVLAVMRSTLEISTSYLKKAAEVLPVRCPLQNSKSTTNKRAYLQRTWKKGCQANIQITNSIFTYNIVCMTPWSPPDYQKNGTQNQGREHEISETALKKEQGVQVTHKYYIKLPTEEAHHKSHLRPKGQCNLLDSDASMYMQGVPQSL